MRRYIASLLFAAAILAPGVTRASDQPGTGDTGKPDPWGVGTVIAATVVQAGGLSLAIVGCFHLDDGFQRARSATQVMTLCMTPLTIWGYGKLLDDGTEKGEYRAVSTGLGIPLEPVP